MVEVKLLGAKHRGGLVASILEGSWRKEPPTLAIAPADFDLVAPVLLDSHLAALIWYKLRHRWPGQNLASQFQDAYRSSILWAEMQAHRIKDVIGRLRSVGLDPILHKGWAAARTYPEPWLRSYSDIDLMVGPDDERKALCALKRQPRISHQVDLYHSEISELDTLSWNELYRRSRLVHLQDIQVRILSAEDHLRSLCIHCLKHGVARPIWLIDVASALESLPDNFDWDRCIGTLEPQANWVRCALSLAHRLLQAAAQETQFPAPGWLLNSVLRFWSYPAMSGRPPSLKAILNGKTGLLEALVRLWPSAGQSCVLSRARFTSSPVLHLQVRWLCAPSRLRAFLRPLPDV